MMVALANLQIPTLGFHTISIRSGNVTLSIG